MSLQITGQAQGLLLATSQKSGAPSAISTGWHNEALVTELLPRYADLVLTGVVFSLNFPAAAFAAPSSTATGAFFLYNPSGSGKNLVLLDTQVALTAFTAIATQTTAVGIIYVANQAPTSTSSTGITIRNNLIGSSNGSIAAGYVSGTLVGAPTLANRIIADFGVLTAVGFANASQKDEIAGSVIVAPGSGIEVQALNGTEADITGIVGITWAELPV
jgi:hypothetical protein